jgi:hypothetical protein
MTMQGCPGEEWAIKAYAAYKERVDGLWVKVSARGKGKRWVAFFHPCS